MSILLPNSSFSSTTSSSSPSPPPPHHSPMSFSFPIPPPPHHSPLSFSSPNSSSIPPHYPLSFSFPTPPSPLPPPLLPHDLLHLIVLPCLSPSQFLLLHLIILPCLFSFLTPPSPLSPPSSSPTPSCTSSFSHVFSPPPHRSPLSFSSSFSSFFCPCPPPPTLTAHNGYINGTSKTNQGKQCRKNVGLTIQKLSKIDITINNVLFLLPPPPHTHGGVFDIFRVFTNLFLSFLSAGNLDAEALINYLKKHSPILKGIERRIHVINYSTSGSYNERPLLFLVAQLFYFLIRDVISN